MERVSLGEGLDRALLDQRIRADSHKANFDTLKAQYLALQESCRAHKIELHSLAGNYDRLARKSHEIIQTLQSERDSKIIECEELKTQVLSPVKLEQLKSELSKECRQLYRMQIESVQSDVDRITREYTNLKYSHTFLKSEYETFKASHQSMIEELTAKHETELSAYIEERKSLLARNERDVPGELMQMRQLQRKNSEMIQKIKVLMSENEDLREEKESSGTLSDQKQQLHFQQIEKLSATIKTLEIEKSSQGELVSSMQRELSACRAEQLKLSDRLSHAQRQVDTSNRRCEGMEHKHCLKLSELKMKHIDKCQELENQREEYLSQYQSCQVQLDAHSQGLDERYSQLAEKEHQVEYRIQAVREKEWEKQVLLEKEKVELEERLSELQQHSTQSEKDMSSQIDTLEDSVRQLTTAKTTIESELEFSKTQLIEKSQELHSLLMEVKQVSAVGRKYQSLLSSYHSLQQAQEGLIEGKKTLVVNVQELEEKLVNVRESGQRNQERHLQEFERERQSWTDEKVKLTSSKDKCQSSKQTLSQQLTESKATSRKLQKHYKGQIQDLRDSLEIAKAEQEKLQTEKQAIEKSLGLENQKLKRKFSDMVRRQKEFQFLLHSHPQPLPLPVLKESTNSLSQQLSQEQEENQDDFQ